MNKEEKLTYHHSTEMNYYKDKISFEITNTQRYNIEPVERYNVEELKVKEYKPNNGK